MTKMATMLKNAQNLKKSSSPEPLGQLPWYVASGSVVLQSFINHYPGLTLAYFKTRSILVP